MADENVPAEDAAGEQTDPLAGMTPEQLADRGHEIQDEIRTLGAEPTDENVARMEDLADEYRRVNDRLVEIEAAETERTEKAQAILAEIAPADAEGEPDAEAEPEAEPEPDAEPEADAGAEAEPEAVAASAAATGRSVAGRRAAALRDRKRTAHEPHQSSTEGGRLIGRLVPGDAGSEFGSEDGMTRRQLAEGITKVRHGFGSRIPQGTRDSITIGTSVIDFPQDRILTGDAVANFGVIGRAVEQVETVVASGGSCAPLAPLYDIFRLAEPQSPVESALPVVGANRGGLRWITPPDFRAARAGVGLTTEAQDAAGYASQGGPTPDKPVVVVECPDVQETMVVAVSQQVRFGNLNYRVFPEQVEAFLADLAVGHASVKEVFYLDGIDDASIATDTNKTYGATRNLVYDAARAATAYRKRNGMSMTSVLDWYLPDWAGEMVKADMVNDHALGMGFLAAAPPEIAATIRRMFNLNIVWYYDSATGEGQAFNWAQEAGALNAFPDTVVSYLFAPGTFVRLDGGTLDVGLVRDSVLNKTNDLEIFSEQWIQIVKVGIESIKITHAVCPDGTGPTAGTALNCASGS